MRLALASQLVRYGFAGLAITCFQAALYWLLAAPGGLDPLLALTVSFAAARAVGFATHSRFTFRGFGARDRVRRRMGVFLLVNLFGYGMNALWVHLLVERMGGPEWWPVAPMIMVTPLAVFALHRRFTFA
ncbi:MAG: GtrA family protein [Sphingomonadaceae bacterium]